jgi:DNA-directed RNA polymerase subunit RPC12/RpoP
MSDICPYCGSKRRREHNGEYKCTKCRAETDELDTFIKDFIVAQAEKEKRKP